MLSCFSSKRMSLWVGLAIAVIYAVAPAVKRLCVDWILTPASLVRFCAKQGIPFVSCSELLKDCESIDAASWQSLKYLRGLNYDKIFVTRFGKNVKLCVADPVLVHQILAANADSYQKPSFIRSLAAIGDGIFSVSGTDWFHQRRLFEPQFLMKEIKRRLEVFTTSTIEAMLNWEEDLQSSNQVDIYQKFLEITFIIFGKFTFGFDLRKEPNAVIKLFQQYLKLKRNNLFKLDSESEGFWSFTTKSRKKCSEIEGELQRIAISLLRKELDHTDFDPDADNDFLTLMINLLKNGQLSMKQAVDNCVTFLLVGHETTASLLTWTTYLLAVHCQWQERLRIEAAEQAQKKKLQWSDISQSKALNIVLFESLRMFPPQPLIGRLCVNENKVGPFTIPEKLEILIPIFLMHRSREYWGDDADEFRPERFSKGLNAASRNPLSFVPFGSGPRTCIGQVFALTEARVIMLTMLNKFTWKLSPQYRHCPDLVLTLHPKFGMPIVLQNYAI